MDVKNTRTLGELMGKQGGKLTLDNLPEVLGEGMPELPKDAVGRHRLTRALKNRFGEGYRTLPAVKQLLQEFDKEMNLKRLILASKKRS